MQPALKFTPRNASAARIDPIVPMSRKGFSAMIAELCEQFKVCSGQLNWCYNPSIPFPS